MWGIIIILDQEQQTEDDFSKHLGTTILTLITQVTQHQLIFLHSQE